jgi:nitrogen fixation NifU-like protein
MSDQLSRQMYQEHILELYKEPHNFGELAGATHVNRAHNPLCGDDFTLQLFVEDGKVSDVKFKGVGCAISMAAASLITDKVKGLPVAEVQALKAEDMLEMLGIPIGPVRLKCALLALQGVHAAIGEGKPVPDVISNPS